MPITAEHERRLLNHYGLNTLYPESWPKADEPLDGDASDEEDDDDDGIIQPQAAGRDTMRKSRFWNIDRHASVRSASSLGPDGLVQKDEADALGMLPSVASELRRRGLPVEDDLKLRNRFMLSSTTFSPTLYLAHVHHDASSDDLLRGLDFLSRSIEQKSASLKVLVESNFEKFVKAKATIDNVYTEMRTHGADGDPEATPRQSVMRPHSRHASRGQAHFRNTSGPFSPAVGAKTDKRKNALTKESEYGVSGIKAPLQDVAIKAEEVWGPALGGREKEEMLKQVLGALEKHREIFNLPGVLADAERNSDYDAIIANWKAAQKYANRARNIADIAKANGSPLAESEVQQILITAKMWHDVSSLIETFKKDVWRRLKNSHGRRPAAMADESDKEEHMELISVLLQIGVNENPIWQWLHSRYLYLKDRIARSFERSRIEIEIMRRKLAANNKQDVKALAQHLKSASDSNPLLKSRGAAPTEMDAPAILAFWEKTLRSLTALLTSPDGLLGEVLDFWETTQSFIDNKAQKAFPAAVFASGLEYIELEPDEVANLRSGTVELIAQIRDSVMSFFNDAPVEDLSELYSPIPPTPITPDSVSGGGSLTPSSRRALAIFDATNVPPPSPIRGDPWENFAFWPPYSNALSGSHYLAKILALVGTAACEMAGMSVIKQTRTSVESLKTLVGAVRERCVTALTAAWTIDAGERCKYLESWTRAPERKDLTTMPSAFMAYEEKVLGNFQKVAYISDAAAGGSGGKEVLFPPPAKLLQSIRGCFVNGLYKTLSAMVENAERAKGVDGEKESGDPDGITTVEIVNTEDTAVDAVIDGRNRNVRMLLTLSNLAHLRSEIIPHLVAQFESSFSVKLTEESKTIRDVLSQIDAREFQSYVKPTLEQLNQIISSGIASPDWAPPPNTRPDNVRPYVYEVLLALVLVHSEVSTTAASLTNQILSYLLEQSSTFLLNAFKLRQPNYYSLPALMQATLDVEFLAQTLNQFTTDRAGEVQSQIYLALDERTDEDARRRLQGELPEMRGVLKRLREGTKGEFGCFRRERRGRTGTAGGGGSKG